VASNIKHQRSDIREGATVLTTYFKLIDRKEPTLAMSYKDFGDLAFFDGTRWNSRGAKAILNTSSSFPRTFMKPIYH
jgi:hypothetical protein